MSATIIKQKKSWRWYKNNPEVIEQVTYCMIHQLSTSKSVEHLTNLGYPMHVKTFKRIENKIKEEWEKKYDDIFKTDFVPFIFSSLEMLNRTDSVLWKIIETSNDPWQIMGAIKLLRLGAEQKFVVIDYPSAASKISLELKKEWGIKTPNDTNSQNNHATEKNQKRNR